MKLTIEFVFTYAGLCKRTQPLFRGGKRVIHFLFTFGSIGFKSMIAPATWVVLAFLKVSDCLRIK